MPGNHSILKRKLYMNTHICTEGNTDVFLIDDDDDIRMWIDLALLIARLCGILWAGIKSKSTATGLFNVRQKSLP